VILAGRRLGKQVIRDITQVTYRDNLQELDSFELTVNNWDAEKREFKFSDSDTFDPGKRLELHMGYFGPTPPRRMIVGQIKELRPSFPAAGQSTLSVSGQNLMEDLRGSQRTEAYRDLTDSQIARRIGERHGLTVRTDPQAAAGEERHTYLLQDNEYDLVFLYKRAESLGYDMFIDEPLGGQSTLYFGPPPGRDTVYKLDYGSSLIEFTPVLDTSQQVGSVRANGWDNVNKRRLSSTARRGEVTTQPLAGYSSQASIERSFSGREEVIATRPVSSKQELDRLARETNERIARNTLTASGSIVGLPDLRAGSTVAISGVGTRFSGRYFVTSTTHTIGDSGYTTQFECRRVGA
jgi:phage protein D